MGPHHYRALPGATIDKDNPALGASPNFGIYTLERLVEGQGFEP